VWKVTHKYIVKEILVVGVTYGLTIFELYLLESTWVYNGFSKSRLNRKCKPTCKLIVAVRTFYQIVRGWWMVSCLLTIYFSSILTNCLKSLTKNGVQRLFKDWCVIVPIDGLYYDKFEALKRIREWGCMIKINGHCTVKERYGLQKWLRTHAFYGETDLCQIKFAIQDLLTGHHNQFFSCTTKSCCQFLVSELKPTIVWRFWASIIVWILRGFELGSHF
jgi:hypothetical protein